MSSNKSTQSQYSKSPSDPSRVIKPVLQSRKKIEKKPAEIKPISSVSKPSPLRRIEKAKKEPEPNLLTYKEQRDLRARKSDTQKAEKRTMKEIEKIQNTIRKNPSSYELTEEVKETQNVVLTNSRTPSLAGQFNFSEFFNASFNETGSVKDRICKHFVQKIVERQESSEAGIGREGEKEQEKIGFGFGETWNEVEGFGDRKVEGKIDTVEDFRPSISDDANLSFEDPNLFMPEIPFFQYNYSNVEILDSEFSCFNEIKQDPDIPLSGTISVLYEIYLDSNIYNVQTTEVFEVQMVQLPSVEPVYYKETGRITINRKPELIIKISKPQIQSKLLQKFSFEYLKKPICGLNYDEKPCKKIEILKKQTFSSWSKPLISSLEVQKSYKKTKKVSYYEFSITKAKAVTKPLIVLQESHKKPKKPENPKSLIKPLILEMTHSPILSTEGQMFLFDSQRSIESFNLPLSNQISLEQVPEPQSHESHAVLILVSKFKILLKKALRIQMLQLRRKQDSSLYVIFSLKKKSALFNHLQYWARLLREDKKRCEMIKRNELSDLKMIQKFLNFSATFIQRNWKGFYIRRYVVPSMKAYREFKFLLRSVVVGWKTRKILKTRRMQGHFRSIKDLKLMVYDMSNETKEGSEALLSRMVEEIPKMHSKMIKDFNSLYRTGTWVALLKSHVVRTSSFSKFCEDGRLKVANRDEMPIKPLLVNYEDLPNDDENIQIQPKKVFRNYLKRKTKSVALPENNEKSVNATEEVKEKFECSQNKDMLKIIKEQVDDLEEEIMQEEKRGEGKPKEFLKRKSQSIKPKKLQWNVKRKIDCWVSKEIYNKKSLKAAPATQKDFFCIEELENIFEQSLRNFVDTSTYLKKFDRISAKTKIPQFKHCSEFLFGVKEENYYEILEDLESHYLRLCTQGIRM